MISNFRNLRLKGSLRSSRNVRGILFQTLTPLLEKDTPYKRLIGMCRWMGSHFHEWSDYNGVAFSIDLPEWGRKFSDFWGKPRDSKWEDSQLKNQEVVVYQI